MLGSLSLDSVLGCSLCVRIDVFLVSLNSCNSYLEQVLHHGFQGPSLRTARSHFCYSQPTRSVVVPYDGDEGRLLKDLTIRA
jgi:hypothetical protein